MYRHQKIKKIRDIISKKEIYKQIRYPFIPLSTSDVYIRTKIGDRLDILSHRFYKDSQLWWIITIANPNVIRRDSLILNPGLEIRIPSNIIQIIDNFEAINK